MKLIRSKQIISGLALAGTLALAGISGFAQQQTTQDQQGQGRSERHGGQRGERGERGGKGRGEMRGGFGGGFFEKLNLTDAQKEQMKQIATRYHEAFKAKSGERSERGDHFDVLNGGTFNEAAVRAAAQARANARVEMEVSRAHMMSDMYNVLTAEQKAQLATARQEREQKRQEWRSRRGTGTGAGRN
ncbi:MAG: motif family protein [Acidobacteriota bacterium]|jgi:protein CpxP|nr:motif family protein [Acidobacteriota bacterium]